MFLCHSVSLINIFNLPNLHLNVRIKRFFNTKTCIIINCKVNEEPEESIDYRNNTIFRNANKPSIKI